MACDPEVGFSCGPANMPQFLWNSHSFSLGLQSLEASQDQGWSTYQSLGPQPSCSQADPAQHSLSGCSSSMSSSSSG